MLNVITSGATPDDALLRGMFVARKAVFVDLLRWDVPVLEGKYEIDQFDNSHATYLILSDDGRHLASARLLPTTREGILSGLYPMLCASEPPSAIDTFEITRFCLDRGLNARERRAARDALVTALASHALEAGITAYCAVAEMAWYQQVENFGWSCSMLGAPLTLDGSELVALHIEITPETPALLVASGINPNASSATPHRRAA